MLDITPKQAIYVGAGVVFTAGFAYGTYNFVKKALENRPPKK